MMAYLLSLDDDELVTMKSLIAAGPSGPDAVRTFVKELEGAGYIKRDCTNHSGMFVWVVRVLNKEFTSNPPTDNPGYVYIFRNGHIFKIGKTTNLKARLKALRSGLVEDSELVHVIESTDHWWAERQLHKRFEKKRVKGEWYALSGPDLEWLTSKQRYDPPPREG